MACDGDGKGTKRMRERERVKPRIISRIYKLEYMCSVVLWCGDVMWCYCGFSGVFQIPLCTSRRRSRRRRHRHTTHIPPYTCDFILNAPWYGTLPSARTHNLINRGPHSINIVASLYSRTPTQVLLYYIYMYIYIYMRCLLICSRVRYVHGAHIHTFFYSISLHSWAAWRQRITSIITSTRRRRRRRRSPSAHQKVKRCG